MKASIQRATVSRLFKSSSTSGLYSCSHAGGPPSSYQQHESTFGASELASKSRMSQKARAPVSIFLRSGVTTCSKCRIYLVVCNLACPDCMPTSDVENAWGLVIEHRDDVFQSSHLTIACRIMYFVNLCIQSTSPTPRAGLSSARGAKVLAATTSRHVTYIY